MPVFEETATGEVALLQSSLDAAGVGVWEYDAGTKRAKADHKIAAMFQVPENLRHAAPLQHFLDRIHPDDVDAVTGAIEPGRPFDITYRIAREGPDQWVRSIGRWGERGGANLLIGVTIDISEERRRQERLELLAQEMRHRVGNTFAVLSGLVGMEAAQAASVEDLADKLRDRLADLSRAQSLTLRNGEIEPEQSLSGLIAAVARPFLTQNQGRFDCDGPPVTLDPDTSTILSMVFYEWLTNALKYGAFSDPDGRIAVQWRIDGDGLTLVWDENLRNTELAEQQAGFGETMQETVLDPIGGAVRREWRAHGVLLTLNVPSSGLG